MEQPRQKVCLSIQTVGRQLQVAIVYNEIPRVKGAIRPLRASWSVKLNAQVWLRPQQFETRKSHFQ
jgi:hypothetical protein